MENMTSDKRLAELVRRFQVCWEEWPEQAIVDGEKTNVGFALDLYGTHDMATGRFEPGCRACQQVYEGLRAIAEWILPKEPRPSISVLSPYDGSVHYAPRRRDRPEIVLTIRILHQEDIDAPVDECELRCLADMKQRLRQLGAAEGQYRMKGGADNTVETKP